MIKGIFSTNLFSVKPLFSPEIKQILNSKKVTDHHAIIPTTAVSDDEIGKLPETERKVLSLIAGRLLCATGSRHIYEVIKAEISCSQYMFTASRKYVLNNGWKEIEKLFMQSVKMREETEIEEAELPEMSEGWEFSNVDTKVSEHETKPLKRYTDDRLCWGCFTGSGLRYI